MRTAQPHPHPNLPPEGEGTQFLPLQGGGQEGDGVDVELRLTVLLEFLSPLLQIYVRYHTDGLLFASYCALIEKMIVIIHFTVDSN